MLEEMEAEPTITWPATEENLARHAAGAPPELSVIVPCRNAARTLGAQLDALACAAGSSECEIILVDNGSTDGTAEVVAQYTSRFTRFRVVDASQARGAAHARNAGAAATRSRFLAFCDADDVVDPGWLVAMRDALERHPLVVSRFDGTLLNDVETLRLRRCPQLEGPMHFQYSAFLPFGGASGMGVRRELFEALGGFDATLLNGEDIDFCWRAQLAGHTLHFEPSALVHVRMRGAPSEVYRQFFDYGMWSAAIYARYRPRGMPAVPWRRGARRWVRLLARLPYVVVTKARRRWLKDAAYAFGLLRGSLRFRTRAW